MDPQPTIPEKTYQRVLLVSAVDGRSIVVIATLGILISLALGDISGAFVGLLVLTAGVIELRGRRQLLRRDGAGMKLLVRAQLLLLLVILVYCVSRLGTFDLETALGNLTPEMEAALKEAGISRADLEPLVQLAFRILYTTVAFVSVLFQGGLILYYRSRAAKVAEFLATPPRSPLA